MTRERLERLILRLFVDGAIAAATAYVLMLLLGALHSVTPLFPAWGYWTCLLAQVLVNAAFGAFWYWRDRPKVRAAS